MEKLFQSLLPSIGKSLAKVIFPPLCLHCSGLMEDPKHPLCSLCLSELLIIDPKERCRYCQVELEGNRRLICSDCRYRSFCYTAAASVFDYAGPLQSLVRQLKYCRKPWLAKKLAPFLYFQFLQQEWLAPDYLIPVPISFTHWFIRGYNQSFLLAEECSLLMDVPVLNCLRRSPLGYQQAGKSFRQRHELQKSLFSLKRGVDLQEKTVLLIDDVMTTGATVNRVAELLQDCSPKRIYVLTVCRS